MAKTTAKHVAEFFIFHSKTHGDVITNLKLQKLIYYAQAWYLAIYKEPLFDDPIEAWIHGPVIYSIYSTFKHYGWEPIPETPQQPILPKDIKEHLEDVYDVFGSISAYDLERMTHREDPWIKARGGLPIDQPSSNTISHKDMLDYYSKLAEE